MTRRLFIMDILERTKGRNISLNIAFNLNPPHRPLFVIKRVIFYISFTSGCTVSFNVQLFGKIWTFKLQPNLIKYFPQIYNASDLKP